MRSWVSACGVTATLDSSARWDDGTCRGWLGRTTLARPESRKGLYKGEGQGEGGRAGPSAFPMRYPAPTVDSMSGCRDWNDINEQEADWLSGELLVPRDMALAVARGRFTKLQARQRLGVGAVMSDWSINKTGALTRVEREQARRRASKRPPRQTS